MIITRPYEAQDNEVNTQMLTILTHYVNKIGEEIQAVNIYELAVNVITTTGKEFTMHMADGYRSIHKNVRHFMYMVEIVNGKRVRIKKENW